MLFNAHEFIDFMRHHGIVQHHEIPITLKSGETSHLYVNWRKAAHDAFLMNAVVGYVLNFATDQGIQPDTFYGVPEGATILGVLTQFHYAKNQGFTTGSHALAMGRRQPKSHGDPTDRHFIGVPRGRVCVLEDVTTTGGSLIDCIRQLNHNGINVTAAISLTNRNPDDKGPRSVHGQLAALQVPYYSLSDASAL
jgi:orotate phosphoribosyltransferase